MGAYSKISAFNSRFLLKNFEIFKELTDDQCDQISEMMNIRQYKAGVYVISEHQKHHDVFFILSGKIRPCAISPGGKQIHFEDLSSGMMFGEFAAIDQQGRSADCLAVQDSMLACVSGQSFVEIMDHYPTVKDAVLRRVVTIVRHQMQRVSENVFYSAGQRVRFELLRLCTEAGVFSGKIQFNTVPTQDEIALRIGTRREAVSRELSSLQSKGLITWNRGKNIIHDIHALTEYAEK